MEDPKLSKLDQLKAAAEEHREALIAGAGFTLGVAATLWCVKNPQRAAKRYPWGSSYNSDQPIPNLLLTEEDIKRRMAAGILAALYIDKQGLTEKYMKWAYTRADEIAEEMAANPEARHIHG